MWNREMGKEAGVLGLCELWRRRERGASLVELSLVLFILILLVAGVIDFGRAFNSYIVINNASREGARYASLHPDYEPGIVEAVKREAAQSSVNPDDLDIAIEEGDSIDIGEPITVTVEYEVSTIIADIIDFGTLPLRARTTMIIFGEEE
jgi:Flp pilus assembly protein TadG